MKFGEKLRQYRKAKGMTQAELAKAAGVGSTTIINYENGKTYPQNREVYITLAKILGVDADTLHNENDDFVSSVSSQYGYRGKKQAEQLITEVHGLFAGGELSDSDKDAVMKALQQVYWECKEENIDKYTPKKYKK